MSSFRSYATRGPSASTFSSPSLSSSSSWDSDLPMNQKEFAESQFHILQADLHRIDQAIKNTLDLLPPLAKSFMESDLETKIEKVDTCKRLVKEGDLVLTQLQAHIPVLDAIKNNMIHSPYQSPESLAEDYESQLTRKITQISANQNLSSIFSTKLDRAIKSTHPSSNSTSGVDEDDIVVTRDEDPAEWHCPLTGTFIQQLLISETCGHPYEKEAILNYFQTQGSRRLECLHSACSSYISLDTLKEDEHIQARILRSRERRERLRTHEEDEYENVE